MDSYRTTARNLFRFLKITVATQAAACCLVTMAVLLGGCATSAQTSIPLANVDLERMSGGWYIVATIPNFFEKGIVDTRDVLTPNTAGDVIHEDFYARRGGFDAERKHLQATIFVLPATGNADWRVQPLWPLRLPFQIYYVDPEYRFALFGEQNRDLGWVYSRTPTISDADYAALLERFRGFGYNTSRFRKMVLLREQLGQPGYWNDGIRPLTEAPGTTQSDPGRS